MHAAVRLVVGRIVGRIVRLVVLTAAAWAARAAWARWVQGPHVSRPGAPITYPAGRPGAADA